MIRLLSLICLISCVVGTATAQQEAVTADSVLERMCAFIDKEPAFQVVASVVIDVTGPRTSHDEVAVNVDLERPNRLRSAQAGSRFQATAMNTDDGYFIHLGDRRQYKKEASKPTLGDALLATAASPMGSDVRFLAYLLEDNSLAGLKTRMSNIAYVGAEDISGIQCDHLRLDEEELSWDVWVDAGAVPLPRRIRPDLTKFIEARRAQVGPDTNATMEVNYTWTHPASFPKGHFTFTPPRDTLFVQEFQAVNPQHPQFQLLAQPAPAIVAQSLDGAPLSLTPVPGEIWILDFWAIWCQPCHMLMPVVHTVAEDYADKGVRLYSINVGDPPADVAAFLTEKSFDTTHALSDVGHSVARDYALESFPMVVLVGKDGTIQTIRTGFGPGYDEQLRKDLDTLVKGEFLVTRPKS